jgi:hypothetical protein
MHVLGGVGLIDFFLFFIFLRVLYSAVSRGIFCEIFKLFGLLSAALLAFHFYPHLAERLAGRVAFIGKRYCDGIAFLSILLSVTSIAAIIRKIVTLLFPPKELLALEKWLALFLGMGRYAFLASVIVYGGYVFTGPGTFITENITFRLFRNVAPATYISVARIGVFLNDTFSINKEVDNYYETKDAV